MLFLDRGHRILLRTTILLLMLPAGVQWAFADSPTQSHQPSPVTSTPEQIESDQDPDAGTNLVDGQEISDSFVDASQKTLSNYIIGLSEGIDSFFGGDRNLENPKGSYGCITVALRFEERGNHDNKVSGCLKLSLPNTKDRFKLIISGSSEEENFDEENQDAGSETLASLATSEVSSSAAVRYVDESSPLKDISFDIGVKSGTPLDPFTRLRYRKTWVPQIWLFRFTENIYYFKSKGGGVLTRFDVERPFIEKQVYYRMTTEADFRDEDNQFYLKQGFSFYHKLADRYAIDYDLFYYGTSRPHTQLDSYLFRIRLRKNIYKDWLYLELRPQADFNREGRFSAVGSFTISLEAQFGKLRR